MILSYITPADQMTNNGWTCTTNATVINIPTQPEELEFCFCNFIPNCQELTMAYTDDVDDNYRNDYKVFINTVADVSSTVEYFIIKDSVEYPFTEDYGEIYAFGFNDSNPLMKGIKINWGKVAETLGYGNYTVKVVQTDFSVPVIFESHVYNVVKYTERRANGTVKLEFLLNGLIQNGRDLGGLNLYNMVRVDGYLGDIKPVIETKELEKSNRVKEIYQKSTYNTYSLIINKAMQELVLDLFNEKLLLKWRVTDYNLFNLIDYRNLDLEVEDLDLEEFKGTKNATITVTLNDPESKVYRPII